MKAVVVSVTANVAVANKRIYVEEIEYQQRKCRRENDAKERAEAKRVSPQKKKNAKKEI